VLCTSCVGIDEARGEAPPLSDSAILALAGLQKSIDLIVFYAPWCNTCPYAKSMVREMAERTDLLSYSFVNVDTNRELAESNGIIRSKRTIVPAIVRVDTGDIIFGIEDLEARLLKVLGGES
jgi:thiol-disulfide isomerase/thioredoxin